MSITVGHNTAVEAGPRADVDRCVQPRTRSRASIPALASEARAVEIQVLTERSGADTDEHPRRGLTGGMAEPRSHPETRVSP
jgi:hypothetical protein